MSEKDLTNSARVVLEKRVMSKSITGKHSLKIRAGVYLIPGNLFWS